MNDDDVLQAFRDAARESAPPVSPFATARAHRNLEAALDAETRARVRWTTPRIAGVALSGALAGAVAVVLVMRPEPTPVVAATTPAPIIAPAVVAPAVTAPVPAVVPVEPVLAIVAPKATPKNAKPAPRARSWRQEEEALVASGDGVGAARVLVRALATDDSAAASLSLLAHRFPDALDAVDAELATLKNAEAMRVRCEQKLLHARDRSAVDACRAFGLEHPENPGARTLAFAAGRFAEDDLGDLAAAEDSYSRALLLSPFVGLPGTDALLARARVREALGNVDEARADLRLYVANEPAHRDDPAVAALAAKLGL